MLELQKLRHPPVDLNDPYDSDGLKHRPFGSLPEQNTSNVRRILYIYGDPTRAVVSHYKMARGWQAAHANKTRSDLLVLEGPFPDEELDDYANTHGDMFQFEEHFDSYFAECSHPIAFLRMSEKTDHLEELAAFLQANQTELERVLVPWRSSRIQVSKAMPTPRPEAAFELLGRRGRRNRQRLRPRRERPDRAARRERKRARRRASRRGDDEGRRLEQLRAPEGDHTDEAQQLEELRGRLIDGGRWLDWSHAAGGGHAVQGVRLGQIHDSTPMRPTEVASNVGSRLGKDGADWDTAEDVEVDADWSGAEDGEAIGESDAGATRCRPPWTRCITITEAAIGKIEAKFARLSSKMAALPGFYVRPTPAQCPGGR